MSDIAINLRKQFPQTNAVRLIPEDMARKYNVIPVEVKGNTLLLAMTDPSDIFALEAIANQTHMRVEPKLATPEELLEAIDSSYKSYAEIEKKVANISFNNEEEENTNNNNNVRN